jgi:RHS repeat-associated protein
MRNINFSEGAFSRKIAFILTCFFVLVVALPAEAGGSSPAGGHQCKPQGLTICGDPVTIGTGNLFQEVTDYESGGFNRLSLKRYYNSLAYDNIMPTFGNWRSNYDGFIYVPGTGVVDVVMPDNKNFYMMDEDGGTGPQDLDVHLNKQCGSSSACSYSVTDWNQTVWVYGLNEQYYSQTFLRLTQIVYRDGYTQTISYTGCPNVGYDGAGSPANCIASVTDSYGRTLAFNYLPDTNRGSADANSVTTPDGRTISYAYNIYTSAGGSATLFGELDNLESVTYPTSASVTYLYQSVNDDNDDPYDYHELISIVDENGSNYASWTYNRNCRDCDASAGFVTSSQNAGGVNQVTLSYASSGSMYGNQSSAGGLPPSVVVTNALGLQSTYNFGVYAVLDDYVPINSSITRSATSSTAAASASTTYDSNGYFASETDWDGHVTTFTNDARGNILSMTQGYGTSQATTVTATYLANFDLPASITQQSKVISFTYDASGNLLTKTVAAPNTPTSTWTYTYNGTGEVLTATDPVGNVTTYAYDGSGNLSTITNPLGQVTSFTNYDANGRPANIEGPNGLAIALTYNFMGQITSKTEGSWVTTYAYDPAWQLIKITRPDNSYLAMTYDGAHRITQVTDALGNYVTYGYDAASNLTSEQLYNNANALKAAHSNTYDALSRLIQSAGAYSGETMELSYDNNNNLTRFTDPIGDATTRAFDSIDRLVQTTDAKGGVTGFSYNLKSELNSVTDPRGLATSYAYNGLDKVTTLTSPDTGVTTQTYDAAGNVISSTDSRGKTATYAYDALNRIASQTLANGTVMTYRYDEGGGHNIGHLTSMSDSASSTSWTYNVHGMATQKQLTIGGTVLTTLWSYNTTTGQLVSMTYPSGTELFYAYDSDGRISGITTQVAGSSSQSALASGIGYRPMGPVTTWTAGNGSVYTRTFDQDNRIATLSLPANDNITLSYDAASRITGISETGLGAKSFAYNKQNRLTSFSNGTTSQIYTYDLSGNRITYSDSASGMSETYQYASSSNQLTGISGTSSESFTYDANGNLASHATPAADYAFSFSARNRLAEATVGATSTVYAYNGLDQRIEKTYPAQLGVAVLFTYDEQGHQIGKYAANGTLQTETVWLGDLPIALIQPTGVFYVAPDYLGAPHEITNAAGQAVWFWDHDPWGVSAPTGSFTNRQLFPGQFQDTETGLDYNYYRDYDPKTGRYIESDPAGLNGGSVATYSYVSGNPLSNIDPLGLKDDILFPAGDTPDNRAVTNIEQNPSYDPTAWNVFSHGAPNEIYTMPSAQGKGAEYSAQLYYNTVRLNPDFLKAKKVVFWGCNTGVGPNSFAEQFSKLSHKTVIAPNGELLSTGKLQGHAIVVVPNDFNWVPYTSDAPNGFKTFTPAAQK